MSLLDDLEARGVTAEDLEKAASVRLFEKAAAAEGIDLSALDDEDVENLFASFLGEEKVGFAVTRAGHKQDEERYAAQSRMHGDTRKALDKYTKDSPLMSHITGASAYSPAHRLQSRHMEYASKKHKKGKQAWNPFGGYLTKTKAEREEKTANIDVVDLFEKQASYEGISLDDLDDNQLVDLYNTFVEEILPAAMDHEKEAQVEEAHAKLAEAEILGRHMARAFTDEHWKMAAEEGALVPGAEKGRGAAAREWAGNKSRQAAEQARRAGRAYMGAARGAHGRLGQAAAIGTPLVAAGGGAYALKRRLDRKKQADAPYFESAAVDRAREFLVENGIDPDTGEKTATIDDAIDARAYEILQDNGWVE